MTRFLPVTIAHPAGTMKLAPPVVTRCVSAVNCSGADRASAAGAAAWNPEPYATLSVKGTANKVRRAIRRIIM